MKKLFTSKILLAAMAIGSFATLSAQTVIKVGASQEAYQKTIQLAYDSIMPDSITGAYILELQADYDPTTEVYPIVIKAKKGAKAENNIVIKPAAGVKKVISSTLQTKVVSGLGFESGSQSIVLPDVSGIAVDDIVYGIGVKPYDTNTTYVKVTGVDEATKTVTISVATTSLQTATTLFFGKIQTVALHLSGAKYVTIDGVSRTGDTGLTIQNPNNIYAKTILLSLGAQYNTVKNCYIKGSNVSGEYNNGTCGTIYFGGGENDFNTFEKNDICDIEGLPMPNSMVLFAGNSNDNTFSENNLYNIGSGLSTNGNAGFFQFPSYQGTSKNYALNNRLYWTKPALFSANISLIGIGGNSGGLGNRVENNVIGYTSADGTGIAELTALPTATAISFKFIDVKNATVKNNIVSNVNATFKAVVGINVVTYSAQTPNANDICSGNTIKDITVNATADGSTFHGVVVSSTNPFNFNVLNNSIKDIVIAAPVAGNKCSIIGMSVANAAHATAKVSYTSNQIMNLTAGDDLSTKANEAYGINIGANTTIFERNLVTNLRAISTVNTGFIRAYQISGSNADGLVFKNNIARIGTNVLNDLSIYGIYQGAAVDAAHPMKIYNNTIYVGGTAPATAAKNTWGFFHTGIAAKNDLKNNIIANKRAVGNTEAHYAMQAKTSIELTSSDYNLYQFGKYFGNIEDTNADDLTVWAESFSTATNVFDAHSTVADPKFVAPDAEMPNMNIQETSPAKGAGVVLTEVTTDFNGFARSTMDIGALAYGSVAGVKTVKPTTLGVYGTSNNIVVKDMMGQTARIYTMNGQLLKSAKLLSDKENISVANGLYIVRVGAFSSKVLVK